MKDNIIISIWGDYSNKNVSMLYFSSYSSKICPINVGNKGLAIVY